MGTKIILTTLSVLLLFLQYELWFAPGAIPDIWQKRQLISTLLAENAMLEQRNSIIIADIRDLKHGHEAVEEYARNELGMVRKGEKLYRIVYAKGSHE